MGWGEKHKKNPRCLPQIDSASRPAYKQKYVNTLLTHHVKLCKFRIMSVFQVIIDFSIEHSGEGYYKMKKWLACVCHQQTSIYVYILLFSIKQIYKIVHFLCFFIETPHKELQNLYFDVYVNTIWGSIAILENRIPPTTPPL